MLKVYLTLFVLAAAAFAESVRETETWVPLKKDALTEKEEPISSGDFSFPEEERTTIDDEDDDDDDNDDYNDEYDDMSGSGDYTTVEYTDLDVQPELFDNNIPDEKTPVKPTEDEMTAVRRNEIAHEPNILLSHAGEQNIFNKKEVLAAVIAGGAVGLLFAALLIVLLVYCMKKKDEGSYDLGKKPIYKKAPTAEIYA